ncbi:hypothetical protein EVAR_96491_1 [Eumeta japonica]|uniref:Uncharacterized protein n=1 Tax=Eumeta variegata TaxID=151549 RepID=A0A4C1ZQX6_EUMVA|nr:hypothetical protein EVAR_96491_1 [Eumeta japonica]
MENMRPVPGRSYRPLTAYDTPSRPRNPDESCCACKTTTDSRLQTTHQDKTSDLQMHSHLTYAAPAWYALCSELQRQRVQAQ